MDYPLPENLEDQLTPLAIELLGGGRRYVHSQSAAITWRFGKLSQLDGKSSVCFDDAQHLPASPSFIPLAVSDDGDALVCLNADLDCTFWYHDEEGLGGDNFKLPEWLADAKRVDAGALDGQSRPVQMPSTLVGTWMPSQVLTPGSKGILKMLPAVEFTAECVWIQHSRTGGSSRDFPIVSLGTDPISL